MFKFGEKKRYTIGEKLSYFLGILCNNRESSKRKRWARLRISQLEKTKQEMRLGDVFVANDALFGNPKSKPRAVVIAEKKTKDGKKLLVFPVKKQKNIMPLSNFDGVRFLNKKDARYMHPHQLYEKRGFRFKKAFLTGPEKARLQPFVDSYC